MWEYNTGYLEQAAVAVDPQRVAPAPPPVVEIVIGGIVVRAGRHVEEVHLQRLIRKLRSA